VDDQLAETTIDTIIKCAKTGKIGDGKIWVTTIDEVIRIRTGESGKEAV
jgi:nitrogen regulatory protein PII